jgi:hypothetical protein
MWTASGMKYTDPDPLHISVYGKNDQHRNVPAWRYYQGRQDWLAEYSCCLIVLDSIINAVIM